MWSTHVQSLSLRRAVLTRKMFRRTILVCVLIEVIKARTTIQPEKPETLAEKLDKLVEKLDRFPDLPVTDRSIRHYAKLDQLNSLNPDAFEEELTEEELEVLTKLEQGGVGPEELGNLAKELKEIRGGQVDKIVDEDPDEGWDVDEPQDESEDYAMDAEGWDTDDDQMEASTAMPKLHNPEISSETDIGPTADPGLKQEESAFRPGLTSYSTLIDPISATAERPRILDDSSLSLIEKASLRRAALVNMGTVVRASKCLRPQPRWLNVRQMAPASDTIYMPPCVQLHRCAPDSGCCDNEAEMCAPIDGKHVELPLFIQKSDGKLFAVRMLFYNHTSCACVSKDNPRPVLRPLSAPRPAETVEKDRPERDDEPANLRTAPPEIHRCTCPGLFQSRSLDNGQCACVCDWADTFRRNECLSLSKGKEHFGLRDRYCVSQGSCTVPTCKYGPYDRSSGKCPVRRFRKVRQWRNARN